MSLFASTAAIVFLLLTSDRKSSRCILSKLSVALNFSQLLSFSVTHDGENKSVLEVTININTEIM